MSLFDLYATNEIVLKGDHVDEQARCIPGPRYGDSELCMLRHKFSRRTTQEMSTGSSIALRTGEIYLFWDSPL